MTEKQHNTIARGCTVGRKFSIGRNEPCPCGSGKKFKRCCMDKVTGAVPYQLDLSKYEGAKSEKFSAYYYRFGATGVAPIDTILKAVAWAGKAYHHTEGWRDTDMHNPSVADQIQAAAAEAATAIGVLINEIEALRAEVERLRSEGDRV